MNILLVSKYSEVEPLGLMYIGSALKNEGHSVNYFLYKDRIEIPNPEQYDVVGFSTYTGNHKQIYKACEELKGKTITAIGGHHATHFYKEAKNYADKVFRGEALVSFLKMDDTKVYPLLNPDNIPFPDRQGFYDYSEIHKNSKIKNIMASFFCQFVCRYCYNNQYKKLYPNTKIRLRSVDLILKESEMVNSDLIFFQDDFFGCKLSWLKEFSEKWNKRPYHCQARIEVLNEYRLKLLKESGCTGLTIAIECANEDYRLKMLGRKISNKVILENCKMILDYGIALRTEQMLGLPETTFEDEIELLKMNCEIKPTFAWTSIYQPYRGTELGEYCVQKGYYKGNNDDVGESFFSYSVMECFDGKRHKQIQDLQEIFAMCSHLPNGWEYAKDVINKKKDLKTHLYNVLYYTEKQPVIKV